MMNGLIVQLTEEFIKIWSFSSRRLITFSREDIPDGSHEGDWITIEFGSNGVLQGVKRTKACLGTRRDERGKMQVLDVFLVNPRRDKAYSDMFGVVEIKKGMGGERWTNEAITKDHCFMLWMTVSSQAQFYIEKQSMEKAYSKDGEYSGTYKSMMEGARKTEFYTDDLKGQGSFTETVLIVGFDQKCKRYFTSSRSGEAYIDHSVWKKYGELHRGDAFLANLSRDDGPLNGVEFKVVDIEKKMKIWDGVEVEVNEKDVRVELDGEIIGRRKTCFTLETLPFGLVTYPRGLGIKAIPEDVHIGDHLRVRISRFKTIKAGHPSKWQVVSVKQKLSPPVEKGGDWFEGIVTCINGSRFFISFKHGNAQYLKNLYDNVNLRLGAVVDICVRDTGADSFFEVTDISGTRTREDMKVEKNEEANRAMFTVTCPAEVMERRVGFFLVDTPIIGLAQFFLNDCPRNMKVGEIWDVKMHRRKDKKDLPSHWVVHSAVGDHPRSVSLRDEMAGQISNLSDLLDDDREWGTVVITGARDGGWFAACYLADTITIPNSLVRNLRIPEKGEFYRIKCSKEEYSWIAYDLNPNPVYPKNFKVIKDRSLEIWCRAKVESRQSKSFTLANDILGEATLPRQFALTGMRVGDEIEALYYRVKTTSNPTHWMVQKVAFISSESGKNREMERSEDVIEERRLKKECRDDCSQNLSYSAIESSPNYTRKRMDRRVIDIMAKFLKMGNDLVDGVVVSSNNSSSNLVFFIQTYRGAAVAFPRVHVNDPDIQLGTYVSVRMFPPMKEGENFEVESITVRKKPVDHNVRVLRGEIQISCEATLVDSINGDFIFENCYLGHLAGKNKDRRVARMEKGTICRITCRRTTTYERKKFDKMGIHWIVDFIDFSQIRPPSNNSMTESSAEEWTTIVVTGCNGGVWEGIGSMVDTVLIPMGDDRSIVRGSIHRVKYFTDSDGTNTAYDMDSVTVPNADIQLTNGSSSNIWCTSRIVARGDKHWTVRNGILGVAKLPLEKINSNMNIGDQVRTMYGRVANKGDDGIVWTVIDIDRSGGRFDWSESLNSYSNESTNITTSTNNTFFHSSTTQSKIDKPIANKRDRKFLDWMRQAMRSTRVRSSFERQNKPALEKIESILARDANNNML